jgi:DNA-binding GntR family transcriptional regulator
MGIPLRTNKQKEAERIIEPNRGAHVSQPTAREAREVFVARRAIEGAVVASITPQGVHHFEAQVNAHMAAEGKATRNSDRRAILQALTAGDNEQAMELMKHHLDHLEAELALGKDQDQEVDLKAVLTSV